MGSSSRRQFLKIAGAGAFVSMSPLNIAKVIAATAADEMVYGTMFGFVDLNPLTKLVHSYQYMMFDALTAIDPDSRQPVAQLAQSWTREDDLNVTFTLRDGITFSDGTVLRASDVKFSFDTQIAEKLAHSKILSTIASASVIDDLTIRFTTKAPDPLLEKRLAMLFIVPEQVYAALGTKEFGAKPVGTGQYVMEKLEPNSAFTLLARPDGWRGAPATNRVTFKVYTDNNAFLAAATSGQMDVAQQLPGEAVSGLSGQKVSQIGVGSPFLMQLNCTQKPFDDLRVRQAMNHGINIDAILRVIMNGVGTRLGGQLPGPDCVGHNPDITDYAYDVEKAKALLKEAGYEAGFETEICGQTRDRAMMEAISGELLKLGITCKVNALDYSVWVEGFNKGTQWPIFCKGLDYGPLYDAEQSYQWVSAGDEGRKGFVDAKWDELLAASRAELDPQKRLAILHEMAAYLHEQAPFVFLFDKSWLVSAKDAVEGLDLRTGKWLDGGLAHKPA